MIGSRALPRAAVLSLAVTGLLTVGSASVLAGTCAKTTRDARIDNQAFEAGVSADTTIVRKSKEGSYSVLIATKKNNVADASYSTKQNGNISQNGDQVSKQVGDVEDVTFRVSISSNTGSGDSATCIYQIAAKDKKSTWDLGDAMEVACTGSLKVSCSKSFRSGAARWNTTFEIND
jgi:PDZ domain-containing secreted protein